VQYFCESGPFERSHHILGFEGAFMAMYDNPEEYKALIEAIADYKVALLSKIIEAYRSDEVFFQDDLGTAQGPMLSMDMYRKFLWPAHKRIGVAIGANNARYTHHSCGKMEAFIDDLLAAGATVFNPVQNINDQKAITARYANRCSFNIGAADVSASREGSTEDEVRAEVRKTIDTFCPYGNTVVMAMPTNINSVDKVEIALDEAREYGAWFYKKRA
jgi:uroporphyrinogen-III decarboxylase